MGRLFSGSRTLFAGALILCASAVLAYQPVWHAGFIWDDDRYVTNNPLLSAPDGLWRIWFSLDAPSQYFPLSYTVLRIGHFLWDLNPAGFHWLNIVLHICNALLVWCLLAQLRVPGSWLAAAIFALHPVQVESVAWISELKNLLMGFFFFLTLLIWIEFLDSAGRRRMIVYAMALLCFGLALAAKSTACTLPAALLLILWWKQKPIGAKAIFETVPFFVLALGAGLIAIWWEKYHQGTRVLVSLSPVERILIASRAIWFYLGKLFWPSNLTFIYPRWRIAASDPTAYCWLVAIGAVVAILYFGRHVFGRGVATACLFFVLTLSPLLGFIMLYTFRYTFVADHYQYLACIGPIALVAAGLAKLSDRIGSARWIAWSGGCVILACLSILTFRQGATYRDIETLWRTTIAKDPGSWIAYNNLGVVELEKGEIDDAIEKYRRSLQLHPDYPEALYNLGSAVLQKGDVDQAITLCEAALKLQPTDADAHVVLGNALMHKQNVEGAIAHYREALRLRPNDSNAHHNLAMALRQQGKEEEAASELEKAGEKN
ncbi:MAG TPA: tetratricopeptide repeat protein [Chthoniobacterales bacterium]|nr:tetratricopeptide repeat protein [Chthoniobacterales bacterium]